MAEADGQPDGADPEATHHLHLFIAGDEPNSRLARANLMRLCAQSLSSYELKVTDVFEDFRAALENRIFVTPALLVERPGPRTVIFGNLSDERKVLAALGVEETN